LSFIRIGSILYMMAVRNELRGREVRSAIRRRTLVHGTMVMFVCKPTHEKHADELRRAFSNAMDRFYEGTPGSPLPALWCLSADGISPL
jgi:hypothetical protein